jgi:hypothetical protein
MLVVISLRLLKIRKVRILPFMIKSTVIMLWFSLALASIFKDSLFMLGGKHGYFLFTSMRDMVGAIGAYSIIIVLALIIVIFCFENSILGIKKILEKIATFIILSLAILVASFCIICTLLLMVTEKSKEIAILKALGATDRGILRIFMAEGMIIGGIGTVFGVATGLAVSLGLRWFGVRLDPDVYYVDRLPINVDPGDFALVAVAALLITTLATLYPALAASRLRPVDGIRYE